jgi:hypothetical protein
MGLPAAIRVLEYIATSSDRFFNIGSYEYSVFRMLVGSTPEYLLFDYWLLVTMKLSITLGKPKWYLVLVLLLEK